MAPNEYDLIDFANFLNQLPWPVNNRYVIIYNEPNQENEWGAGGVQALRGRAA